MALQWCTKQDVFDEAAQFNADNALDELSDPVITRFIQAATAEVYAQLAARYVTTAFESQNLPPLVVRLVALKCAANLISAYGTGNVEGVVKGMRETYRDVLRLSQGGLYDADGMVIPAKPLAKSRIPVPTSLMGLF